MFFGWLAIFSIPMAFAQNLPIFDAHIHYNQADWSLYPSDSIFKLFDRAGVQAARVSSTPGLIFQKAWKRREKMVFQGQGFYVVSKEDLVTTKRASGREIVLTGVRLLEIGEEKKSTDT